MRTFKCGAILCALLMLASISNPAPLSGVQPFLGRWKFANPQSYDLPRIEVSLRKDQCILQIWYISTRGVYVPWEPATIRFYRVGESNEYQGVAKWNVDFGEEMVIARVQKGRLVVELFSNYNDEREDIRSVYIYAKSKDTSPWPTVQP